jgi:hypothetical protein
VREEEVIDKGEVTERLTINKRKMLVDEKRMAEVRAQIESLGYPGSPD